jgi:hypothetical protein
LDHLARRARKDNPLRVAPSLHDLPGVIDQNRMAQMRAFQKPAAPKLDHRDRFAHQFLLSRMRDFMPKGLSRIGHFGYAWDIE